LPMQVSLFITMLQHSHYQYLANLGDALQGVFPASLY